MSEAGDQSTAMSWQGSARGRTISAAESLATAPSRPLKGPRFSIAVWAESELVQSGVRDLLAPYGDWLEVLPADEDVSGADLVLADPFAWSGALGDETLSELSAVGNLVVCTWAGCPAPADAPVLNLGPLPIIGWLSKALDGRDLASALRRIHGGDAVLQEAAPAGHPLTVREAQVVALIATGMTNQEIADSLYVSVNSVKTYIRSAYRKMDVVRRTQAVLWAREHGLHAADDQLVD